MNKKLAGAGLAIGLVAGAGAGLILELSGSAGATSANPVAAVSAAAVDATTDTTGTTATSGTAGTASDPARPDASTRLQEVLKPLVDDGTITQAQADKVVAALVAARPDGFPGGGHRGFGDHHGFGFGLDTIATTLGITADEVRTALQGGQSIADLAVSKGKTAQAVIDALTAEAKTHLDAKVTSGDITQAQADQRLTELTTAVTAFVNNTPPVGGRGFDFPRLGGRGGPGRHGDDNDADDAPSATTAPADTSAPTPTTGS